MFRFWRKEYTLKGKFTLTLQPYYHLLRLLPSPGLHCSTHWAETILGPGRATVDNTNESFVGPWAFSAAGVRRSRWWKVGWGGGELMGRHSYGGGRGLRGGGWIWWQGFSCFAKMVWNNHDIMRLWTQKKYTNSTRCDCWPHHLLSDNVEERENKIADLLTALELVLTPFSQHWTFVKTKSQRQCWCQSRWMRLSTPRSNFCCLLSGMVHTDKSIIKPSAHYVDRLTTEVAGEIKPTSFSLPVRMQSLRVIGLMKFFCSLVLTNMLSSRKAFLLQ